MRQAFTRAELFLAMEASPQTIAFTFEVDALAVVAAVVVAGNFCASNACVRGGALADRLAVFDHTFAVLTAGGGTDRYLCLAVMTGESNLAEAAHLLL